MINVNTNIEKGNNQTHHTSMLHKFNTHLFAIFFFLTTFVTCPQTWERTPEHSKDKREHCDSDFITGWDLFLLLSSSSEQEWQTWVHLLGPWWPPHTHWAEMCKTVPWSALFTLGWDLTKQASYSYSSWYTEEERVNIICVMRPNTENLHLYTRQSQEEGFQLVITRIVNDNTLQAALQGGESCFH